MVFSTAYASDVAGIQLSMRDTLAKIDDALDRGDRRAFAVWSKRWRSLALRVENLLLRIATAEG